MGDIVEKLGLSDFLRFMLAGFFFLFGLRIAFGLDLLRISNFSGGDGAAMLAIVAFVIGCAIYMCHRSFIYPLIYVLIHFFIFGYYDINCTDLRRWKNDRNGGLTDRLLPWASEVHALYCSGWALVLSLECGKWFCLGGEKTYLVAYGAVIFIFLGFFHHFRYLLMLKHILDDDGKFDD
jgi:hypothetical protein